MKIDENPTKNKNTLDHNVMSFVLINSHPIISI